MRHHVDALTDRHDLRQSIAGLDDLADGVDLQVHHDAVALGADVDPAQHVLGDPHLLAQVGQLSARRVELLGEIVLVFLLRLVDLQLRLLDLMGQPRDVGLGLAEIAFDARALAIELEELVARVEALVDQRLHVVHLGGVARELVGERSALPVAAGELLLLLGDLRVQDVDLVDQRQRGARRTAAAGRRLRSRSPARRGAPARCRET